MKITLLASGIIMLLMIGFLNITNCQAKENHAGRRPAIDEEKTKNIEDWN